MKQLTVTNETFCEMLSGIIESGVTFQAIELPNGDIQITFLGGY